MEPSAQTTSYHKKFRMRIKTDHTKEIEGIFSWNGTRNDLNSILEEVAVRKHSGDAKLDDDSDINLVISAEDGSPSDHVDASGTEADPAGASTFVIAVVLIYGFSIVFLIASHVFIKRRSHSGDSEKQINNYLEQAPQLKDESQKESFKKLKKSLIPMIAQSPSGRAMIAKRVKYTPYLVQYLPFTAITAGSGEECERRLSAILENSNQRSFRIVPRRATINIIDQRNTASVSNQQRSAKTDVIVHVHSDHGTDVSDDISMSSEEHDGKPLENYLYGSKSLDEILEAQESTSLDDIVMRIKTQQVTPQETFV